MGDGGTFSRIERHRRFINELLPELNAEAGVKSVRIELQNEPPSARLRRDVRRLRQFFFNLLHNAADVLPGGGTIILRFQRDEREVITEMEDTGPGIAPEIAGRLSQPFATQG